MPLLLLMSYAIVTSLISSASATVEMDYQYHFACTQYSTYHCDMTRNGFDSSVFNTKYTKVLSSTREPSFVDMENGKALVIKANALESISVEDTKYFRSDKFSVYLAFRPDNNENIFGNIISYTNGFGNAGWELSLDHTDDASVRLLVLSIFNAEGQRISPQGVILQPDQFAKVAITFDGMKAKIFLNGNVASEASFSGQYDSDPGTQIALKFAGGSYCSCNTISVTLDELRYYDYPIPDYRIANIDSNQQAVDAGLIGYWKFDGDMEDSSGKNNDAFYNTLVSSMIFSPDGRLFYAEKNSGNIRIVLSNGTLVAEPFATLSDVYVDWENGLLGITLDNKFEENHFMYAFYNYQNDSGKNIFGRVVRLTDFNNTGIDETTILGGIPTSKGFHTGGALAFNNSDDKLYVFVGDATMREKAQDPSVLNGKILRINRDGTIPADNPFPNSVVYTIGHRNAFGIAFDNDGNGILAESGPSLYDEVNHISKGGNYGWPTLQLPDMAPEIFTNNSSTKPIRSYFQPPTPTQTLYYDHSKYPELRESFVMGTVRGYLLALKVDFEKEQLSIESKLETNFYPYLPTVAIAASPDGTLYFGGYGIFRLDSITRDEGETFSFPVQINSTNIKVNQLNYYEDDEDRLIVDLEDQAGPSTVSVKVPQKVFGKVTLEPSIQRENTVANDGMTTISMPHLVQTDIFDSYATVTIHLPDDYSKDDKLQFIVSGSEVSVTKVVPEFSLPAIALAMTLLAITLVALTNRMTKHLGDHKTFPS